MLESFTSKENFSYTKLSEAEQKARGILGRLVGPIADTQNPTRNGRGYIDELWENVTNDPIFQEKIKNRCCFGELGHPADREEVLPEKIAICLAEVPKKGPDGKLYGVFDILPTPNGKILKILCDYGCNIGISSRGSGDIISDNAGNDIVDPDTYNFECFDAVLIPAVETARMQLVNESLTTKKGLKQALAESLKKAKDEDRAIMTESLNELNIELDEAKVKSEKEAKKAINDFAKDLENDKLIEKVELEEDDDNEIVEFELDAVEEKPAEDEAEDQTEDEAKEGEEDEAYTVKNLTDDLKDFDEDFVIEFSPILIDNKECSVTGFSMDAAEDKLVLDIQVESAPAEEAEEIDNAKETSDEETVDEIPTEEEAIDDGTTEVMESLKSIVREKDALLQENAELKKAKAVNDVEVKKLKEELDKVNAAFARTGELAAQGKKAMANAKALTEQLNEKNAQIKNLEIKVAKTTRLTEGNDKNLEQINNLKEQIKVVKSESEANEAKLMEQVNKYKAKFNESLNAAKAYKQKFNAVLNHYIESKAHALGVKTSEITNRLSESYTLNDIDKICEELLDCNVSNKIPFNTNSNVKIQMNESKSKIKVNTNKFNDDDDLSDLYELAGLK